MVHASARRLDGAPGAGDNAGVCAQPSADAQSISDLKARAEAGRAGRPFLVYLDGDERQRLFVLEPDCAAVEVGRGTASDVRVEWDAQVSRAHARFVRAGDAWEVVDDGMSRNGTFVNAERLSGRRRLHDGDRVRVGSTTITFRVPAPGAAEVAGVALSTTQHRVLAALCRPYKGPGRQPDPATDDEISADLFMPVGAVRTHLSVLCAKLGVPESPSGAWRAALAERAFSAGLISERDL